MYTDTVDISRVPPVVLKGAHSYQNWSEAIAIYLKLQGVWCVVSGAYIKPVVPRATHSTTPSSSEADTSLSAVEEAEKKLGEWEEENDKAIKIICSTVSQRIRRGVIHFTSAKDLWEELKTRYYVVQPYSLKGLQTAIRTLYENCSGIEDYISKMSAALDEFSASFNANEKLPEMVKIQFLLCNLGDVWGTFLTAYIGSRFDKKTATYNEVSHILIQEERRVKSTAKYNASMRNLAKEGKQVAKKARLNCSYCGKKGHTEAFCWNLHPEKKPAKYRD